MPGRGSILGAGADAASPQVAEKESATATDGELAGIRDAAVNGFWKIVQILTKIGFTPWA
jgi:hypothetical protein